MYWPAALPQPLQARIEGDAVSGLRLLPIALAFIGAGALALAAILFVARPSSPAALEVRLPETATATPADGQM